MRALRWAAVTLATLAATSVADAPREFPARFTDHEAIVAVGIVSGGGRVRRHVERGANDDVLVFDDATNLHFEDADAPDPPLRATWKATSPHVVRFTFTPEVVAALKEDLRSQVPFRLGVRVGRGRLEFAKDGSSYHGTQTVTCVGNYRGVHVSIRETIRYSGTRETVAASTAPGAATLTSGLGSALDRLAVRFGWTTGELGATGSGD